MDLPGIENKKPSELSGGMRKRVGLARAIVYQPQIVLYDEPTTGLDPIVSDSIDQLILRVRDRLDVTSVVVTHDMRSARRLGQRILMLHNKKIYATGTPDEIFGSQDPVVRQFVEGVSDLKEAILIMKQSRLEWKVGLFVFIGLVLLAGLLIEFSKGLTLFRSTYEILLRADTAGSLKSRAQVLMSGVQVGTVSDIHLAPNGKYVTIILRIYNEYKVYKSANFAIEQSGFLGDEYVAIIPTTNEGDVFANGEIAHAEPPFNMLEVARSATGFVKRIDETAQRLNDTVVDVRRYLLNRETLTNLAVSASNLRVASERAVTMIDGIDGLVTTNTPALAGTGTNLANFSKQLILFAGNLNALLATNGPVINRAVQNVEDSTAMLKTSMEQVQSGKGLAGALLKNDQIAVNLSEISRNLSVTSSNLNRLGLWGILWRHREEKASPARQAPLTSPKNAGE